MMLIPLKIKKTLILLTNQKENLVQDIFECDFLDIRPSDGNFFITKAENKQQIQYFSSSRLKKFMCKICISKIKNNQSVIKISCQHIFHEQCFKKYAMSIMKQQPFILTCKICNEGVNVDKQELYLIKEVKSKVQYKK
ncbi:unnamed protein product [Paramecium primaurelia]|uniref:RING-type domain-containing protein n=1 Tax=Paramecium primaurelia TaxID=5886 RepID=A0A8S1MMY0_PARPR|nr:unnamed protein product [Paramecium primaurelia]